MKEDMPRPEKNISQALQKSIFAPNSSPTSPPDFYFRVAFADTDIENLPLEARELRESESVNSSLSVDR